jgi:deoxyribonuclease-4
MALGAHISAAGGLHTVFERAEKIGAKAIQIFGASPRAFRAKVPNQEELMLWKAAWKKSSVEKVYLHAAYLVNLASPEAELRQKSILSLADHLEIAEALSAEGVIFHLGSGKGKDVVEAETRLVEAILQVIEKVSGRAKLFLENSAGGGAKLGVTIEQVGRYFKTVHKESKRTGVCIDTAHSFESGAISTYDTAGVEGFISELDLHIGLTNIPVFHVNDSATTAGSFHDKHANLGKGEIGLPGLTKFTSHPKLKGKDFLLEVPGMEGEGPDLANMQILEKISK